MSKVTGWPQKPLGGKDYELQRKQKLRSDGYTTIEAEDNVASCGHSSLQIACMHLVEYSQMVTTPVRTKGDKKLPQLTPKSGPGDCQITGSEQDMKAC